MKRFALLLFLSSFLYSCAIARPPIPPDNDDTYIKAKLLAARAFDKGFEVYVTFEEWTDHEWVVQEILLDSGGTVVECFKTPNGRLPLGQRDRHWDTSPWPESWRHMLVYPATVEGADTTTLGFAMLPQNRDGSVKTTTGPFFNEGYRKNHKIKGKITSDSRDLGIVWTINYTKGALTVTLPNNVVYTIYDPIHYKEEQDGNQDFG